jgi:hypothetical protein
LDAIVGAEDSRARCRRESAERGASGGIHDVTVDAA